MNKLLNNAGYRIKDLSINLLDLLKVSIKNLVFISLLFLLIQIIISGVWIFSEINEQNLNVFIKILILIFCFILSSILSFLIFYKYLINLGVNNIYDRLNPEIEKMNDYFINEWDKQKDHKTLSKPADFFHSIKEKLPKNLQFIFELFIKQIPLTSELTHIQRELKSGNKDSAKAIFRKSLDEFIKKDFFDIKIKNLIYWTLLIQLLLSIGLIYI